MTTSSGVFVVAGMVASCYPVVRGEVAFSYCGKMLVLGVWELKILGARWTRVSDLTAASDVDPMLCYPVPMP